VSILWLKLPISQENLFRDSSTGFAIQPVMLIYRSHSVFWCSRYVVYGQFMPAETPYWPKWFVLRPPWLPPSAGYGLYVGLFWNGCDRLRMIVSMRYLVILFVCCSFFSTSWVIEHHLQLVNHPSTNISSRWPTWAVGSLTAAPRNVALGAPCPLRWRSEAPATRCMHMQTVYIKGVKF